MNDSHSVKNSYLELHRVGTHLSTGRGSSGMFDHLQILVQKVFERDLSRDSICKKLEF